MISVTVFKDSCSPSYKGFCTKGHAEYADSGEDIVCSAASALVITCVNGIETFTEDVMTIHTEDENGIIDVRFDHCTGHDTNLLISTMLLGLQQIKDDYGDNYIHLFIEEV